MARRVVSRSPTEDIEKSGWIFRVTAVQDDVELAIDEMVEEIRGVAEVNMIEAQKYALLEVQKTLGFVNNRPRRKRKKKGQAREMTISAENQPPEYQSGKLQKSWKARKPKWMRDRKRKDNPLVLRGELYSRHPAAGALEFGAPFRTVSRGHTWEKKGGKGRWKNILVRTGGSGWKSPLAPRPYYRPTIAKIADRLAKILWGDL